MNFTLLTILLISWLFYKVYRDFLSPKWYQKKRKLKILLKELELLYYEENCHLNNSEHQLFIRQFDSIKKQLKEKHTDLNSFLTIEKNIQILTTKFNINITRNNFRQTIRSFFITIVVILTLRNFFLMPFVIPTGSMQPTLHGINYYYAGEKHGEAIFSPQEKPSQIRRALETIYYGRSYVDSPLLSPQNPIKTTNPIIMATNLLGIPFLQNFITIQQQGKTFYFPGIPDTLQAAFYNQNSQESGRIKGHVEVGDFLLVNRWSYYFSSPKRGDIVVFSTSSLKYRNKKLRGVFYVKRLIGIGGDTVRIDKDNQTWIKASNKQTFEKLQKINPKLTKLFSNKGGYKGHVLAAVTNKTIKKARLYKQGKYQNAYTFEEQTFIKQANSFIPLNKQVSWKNYILEESKNKNILNLTNQNDTLTFKKNNQQEYILSSYKQKNGYKITINNQYYDYYIPKGYYFTLGDNTRNSLDSRYWGVVPQKELVGKPLVIFWPFSHRWGQADKGKIFDFITP